MKEAVKQTRDGVVLDLEVSPGAKKTGVHGFNIWRKRIEIRLSERSERGRANEQLISFFADLFNIDSRNIQIITGLIGSKKSVKITGIDASDILKVLNEK